VLGATCWWLLRRVGNDPQRGARASLVEPA